MPMRSVAHFTGVAPADGTGVNLWLNSYVLYLKYQTVICLARLLSRFMIYILMDSDITVWYAENALPRRE